MTARLLIVLAACSPVPTAPTVQRESKGDDCRAEATARLEQWQHDYPDELVVARLYQTAIAACAGPDVEEATAALVGAANVDYERAARMVIADLATPAQYLAVSRDRSAKLRVAARDPHWAQAFVHGDQDGDLVPDERDRCPDTPELTATDLDGCPLSPNDPPPPAPSSQEVRAALANLHVVFAPSCEGAPPPNPAAPVQLGYDRAGFRGGGGCVVESTKDLCFDETDNNCNGLVDEGCPGALPPRAQIVVSRALNQPDKCVVFYEVDGVMSASDGSSPPQAFHLVFRDFEDTREGSSPATDSPVASFKFDPGQTAGRDGFYAGARNYDRAQWRVRAVAGSGLAAVWSAEQTSTLTFTR